MAARSHLRYAYDESFRTVVTRRVCRETGIFSARLPDRPRRSPLRIRAGSSLIVMRMRHGIPAVLLSFLLMLERFPWRREPCPPCLVLSYSRADTPHLFSLFFSVREPIRKVSCHSPAMAPAASESFVLGILKALALPSAGFAAGISSPQDAQAFFFSCYSYEPVAFLVRAR